MRRVSMLSNIVIASTCVLVLSSCSSDTDDEKATKVDTDGSVAEDPGDEDTNSTAPESNDPRTRLLENNPSRIGFGASATGGDGDYVYVKNFEELQAALEQEGNYVLLAPEVAGQEIVFTHTIYPADNTTLDGSLAPGHSLVPSPNMTGSIIMLNAIGGSKQGNQIFHSIKLDGKYSEHGAIQGAIQIAHGNNFWIDHVEVTDFLDDGILVGFTQSNGADYITVSNSKMHNTGKALLLFFQDQINHGQGHVTAFFNEMAAAERNPLNRGAEHLHLFNNWIHDWRWEGLSSSGKGATNYPELAGNRTVDTITLSQSNYFEAPNADIQCAERADPAPGLAYGGWVYTDGQSIYEGNVQTCGAPRHLDQSSTMGPGAPNIPYPYELKSASDAKTYIQQNAGPISY